ncbi:hypothetical protein [Actinokineospora sp.]|uniref:hypothetical protein n=1 Tax=Actinokineospora sp. TaxID=1872133 RepID=UPI003D6A65AD
MLTGIPASEVTQSATTSAPGSRVDSEGADVAAHAGRRLRVHRRDDLGRGVRGEDALDVDGLSPVVVDAHDLAAVAPGDVDHPLAEEPVHRHDHDVTWSDEVRERGLHADRAGARQRQGAGVLRAPHDPQARARLIEHAQELRVQVAEQRRAERGGRLRIRVRRSGSEQYTVNQCHAVDFTDAPGPPPVRARWARDGPPPTGP